MKVKTLYAALMLVVLCSLAQNAQAKASALQDYFQPLEQRSQTNAVEAVTDATLNQFVHVPVGSFMMGNTSNADYSEPDEFPAHQVSISSFFMSKHEVTQAEYLRVMQYNPSCFTNGENLPLERVSWYNAIEYCNRLSIRRGLLPCYTYGGCGTNPNQWPHNWNTYFHNNISCNWNASGFRLPTEAEWQYAAKGGPSQDNYIYSGSNNLNDVGWYYSNGSQTHTIMAKQPNQLGIYDMTGNVWEWCWDWYGSYTSFSQQDPRGPDTGLYKVRLGGAWDGANTHQRTSNRSNSYIFYGYEGMGFRVVKKAAQ